jgi:hypothetical protein
MTQVITGHIVLNGHLNKMGFSTTSICSKCGTEEETRNRFLGDCDAYCLIGFKFFGVPFVEPEELCIIPLTALRDYIGSTERFNPEKQGVVNP